MDLFEFEQKEDSRIFMNKISTLFVIMILIALYSALTGCSVKKPTSEKVWRHHLFPEGYLKIDYNNEWLEKRDVLHICKKIGINENKIINKYQYSVPRTFNNRVWFKHYYETWIPVKKEHMDKTKTNIFGKEKYIVSKRLREKYKPQIK